MSSSEEPIACTLSPNEAEAQALEWVDLQQLALRTKPLAAGASMAFPSEHAERVAELADREQTCCSFLNITTALQGDEFVVEITADNPDAVAVIDALSGVDRS